MKRISMLMLAAVIGATLSGCALERIVAKTPEEAEIEQQLVNHDEENAVARLVEEFGIKLKMVSLLAPQDVIGKSMEEHYASYVSGKLLAEWQRDPELAPGRMVSSPWPERIEIGSVEKIADNAYQVSGDIIEVTSTDLEKEDAANKIPITITVIKFESGWLIDDVS